VSNFFDNFYSGVADLLRLGLSEFPIGAQTAVDLIAQEFCIEAADLCEIFVERNGVSPEEYQAALASNARSGASSAVAHDCLFTDADARRVRSIFAEATARESGFTPNKAWIQSWQEERSRRRRALSFPPDRNRPEGRRPVLPEQAQPLSETPGEEWVRRLPERQDALIKSFSPNPSATASASSGVDPSPSQNGGCQIAKDKSRAAIRAHSLQWGWASKALDTTLEWFTWGWFALVLALKLAAVVMIVLKSNSIFEFWQRFTTAFDPLNAANDIVDLVLLAPAVGAWTWLNKRRTRMASMA